MPEATVSVPAEKLPAAHPEAGCTQAPNDTPGLPL